VLDVLERPVVPRCQIRKVKTSKIICRNDFGSTVGRRGGRAYLADSALEAQAALLALAKEFHRTHPGASASLREGLDETLTVLRLGVPPTLARARARPTSSSP
jgi:putative transposase